jgi:hypothetical protein
MLTIAISNDSTLVSSSRRTPYNTAIKQVQSFGHKLTELKCLCLKTSVVRKRRCRGLTLSTRSGSSSRSFDESVLGNLGPEWSFSPPYDGE